jgi:hypothetical protein
MPTIRENLTGLSMAAYHVNTLLRQRRAMAGQQKGDQKPINPP